MKKGVYGILKARFLVNEDATKNWRFIVFVILLAILMIANTNYFEQKIFRITELTNEVKELRSEFVDNRSELMKLKMESTVSAKMVERNIFPSSVPPKKITIFTADDNTMSFEMRLNTTKSFGTSNRPRLSISITFTPAVKRRIKSLFFLTNRLSLFIFRIIKFHSCIGYNSKQG